jgi:hypothetical protein
MKPLRCRRAWSFSDLIHLDEKMNVAGALILSFVGASRALSIGRDTTNPSTAAAPYMRPMMVAVYAYIPMARQRLFGTGV